jgi:DNA integrity scanning protein DisA with diadenylate cyclase activity
MIVFCILRQAQSKVFALALIDSEVFVYVFMNKFFAQQYNLLLHQLTYSCRLQEFDDQVTFIDDIIHVIKFTMILDKHIERLFFYVIELNQYSIIMSLS